MIKLFVFLTGLLTSLLVVLADSVSPHQARPLKLQSLCGNQSYSNGPYLFNSFYRLNFTKDLDPLYYYTWEKEIQMVNPRTSFIVYLKEIRKFIPKIYSKYLTETMKTKKFEIGNVEKYLKWQWSNGDNFKRLMTIFQNLNADLLSEHLVSSEELKQDLKVLRNTEQRSAFRNQLIDVFYEEPITLVDDFSLDRKNEWTWMDSSSVGRISFSLYVPFYDSSLLMTSNTQPCTCAQRLPRFFPKDSCGKGT